MHCRLPFESRAVVPVHLCPRRVLRARIHLPNRDLSVYHRLDDLNHGTYDGVLHASLSSPSSESDEGQVLRVVAHRHGRRIHSWNCLLSVCSNHVL